MQHIYIQFGRHICLGAYGSDGKCMYNSACHQIFDCTKVICSIYADIVVLCAHEVIGICGI